jgi:hypothetical protein
LGVGVQNFPQLGGRADFLRPFIRSHVSDLMQFPNESDKGTASVHQILCKSRNLATEALAMIRQALGEESMSHPTVPDDATSCPGLSLVVRAGFPIKTQRQSNNPPNGKVQTHRGQKSRNR